MRRVHRRAHIAIWPLLAIALTIAVIAALILRPPPEPEGAPPAPAATETRI